jgi:hypothetical protein
LNSPFFSPTGIKGSPARSMKADSAYDVEAKQLDFGTLSEGASQPSTSASALTDCALNGAENKKLLRNKFSHMLNKRLLNVTSGPRTNDVLKAFETNDECANEDLEDEDEDEEEFCEAPAKRPRLMQPASPSSNRAPALRMTKLGEPVQMSKKVTKAAAQRVRKIPVPVSFTAAAQRRVNNFASSVAADMEDEDDEEYSPEFMDVAAKNDILAEEAIDDDDEDLDMTDSANVKPVVEAELSVHMIRNWEKESGKKWYKLSPAERLAVRNELLHKR